jgi:hypothetical protein
LRPQLVLGNLKFCPCLSAVVTTGDPSVDTFCHPKGKKNGKDTEGAREWLM